MASQVSDIVVSIGADISALQRGTTQAGKSLDGFGAKATAMATKLSRIATVGTAVAASVGGIAKYVTSTAAEIERMSQIAGVSIERFQSMAYAAGQYGIQQDKLSDILKDVNDKMGDFFQTGAGPMKDFFENIAPKIGITADAFRDLSSADALQLYVSSLEKANVSQSDLTFYMEALANDATALYPLLANNATALRDMEQAGRDLGVVIDEDLIKRSANMNRVWNAVMDNMQAKFVSMASTVLQGFDDIFGITSQGELNKLTREFEGLLDKRARVLDSIERKEASLPGLDSKYTAESREKLGVIEAELNAVNSQIIELQQAEAKRNEILNRMSQTTNTSSSLPPASTGSSGGGGSSATDAEARADQLSAMFDSERELELARYAQQLEDFAEYADMRALSEAEKNARLEQMAADHAEAMRAIDTAQRRTTLSAWGGFFGDLSSLMSTENKKLFAIGKAAAIAEAVISGQQAAVDAWKWGMKVGGPPTAAAFAGASLAKTGAMIAQIASTNIGSSSSGSSSSGGGSSSSSTASSTPAMNFIVNSVGGTPGSAQVDVVEFVKVLNSAGVKANLRFDKRLIGA